MAENVQHPPTTRKLPACDMCHARKVKCDRKRQCLNCSDALINCIRSRQRRPRRPRLSHAIKSQNPSPADIDDSSSSIPLQNTGGADTTANTQATDNAQRSNVQRRGPARSYARKRKSVHLPVTSQLEDQMTSGDNIEGHTQSPAENMHQTEEAQNLIRGELESNTHLSLSRRRVLESALSLVNRFANTCQPVGNRSYEENLDDETVSLPDCPHAELLYMMLGSSTDGTDPLQRLWPDHISNKTMERMFLALMNGTATGQVAHQYKVNVYVRAVMYFSRWLRAFPDGELSESLAQSKKKYVTVALASLRKLDFLSVPSLSLLQSLLSGTILVQLLGDASRAWVLNAFASQVLVSLGYHNATTESLEDNDSKYEIHDCIFWCYYYDKTLSMLLVRPPSLPNIRLQPTSLVRVQPKDPLTWKVRILVRLSQVQETALSLVLRDKEMRVPIVAESLRRELESIQAETTQAREQSKDFAAIEWDAVDFTTYAIFTTILRLSSTSLHDHDSREECLFYARKALASMISLQTEMLSSNKSYLHPLPWTILLTPLTPFYVVFCNVVATSNARDLRLLQEITTGLSRFISYSPPISNVHGLFSQFIGLCGQIISAQGDESSNLTSEANAIQPAPHSDHFPISQQFHDHQPMTATDFHRQTSGIIPDCNEGSQVQIPTFEAGTAPKEGSLWDNGLMWELFNAQPSIEWFDPGFRDAIPDF
ncbi:hypothetical protein ASPWEDRAFT_176548 [Aspergillus wentii DTO 134E9]|uniref:Zn(2)-C6 fungal-type domain-containing protein n=1 Tax=Aspergillus wentii DTO 134E9 TaxID=1073089 RepID=A0A1L9R973_ASPWE|nr:uncharacterized protein ASPWEDRAFT_176548 [Aspergillus wentii DTO 134E9]KAI9926480.1 hypothetical protein MW887_004245 [Aspergillus wentii]OJJ31481.1 hypothetical protein ASPWEDRAFT_176548 [Aspergillus wentii DTO 134E9]